MPGNLPPGVVQLNGRAPGPPVPPVHPKSQPHGFPPPMQPAMPPANPAFVSDASHGPAPPPPTQAIPRDLRPTTLPADVLDMRTHGLVEEEEDAFELLTSYVVILIEKAERPQDFDERGKPIRSGWERVHPREQMGISKKEATWKIWFLGIDEKPVHEKKAELSPIIQHQLERQLDKLNDAESDPRYHHELAQFEVHLRKIEGARNLYTKHGKDKKYSRPSKSKHPRFERSAITAYFRRSPRPECSAKMMLAEREREQQRLRHINQHFPAQMASIKTSYPQHMHPQSQQQHAPAQMQAPFQHAAQPHMPAATANPAARGNPAAQNGPKPVFQDNQPKPAKEDTDVKPAGKPNVQIKQEGQDKQNKETDPGLAQPVNNQKAKAKPPVIIIPHGKRDAKRHDSSRSPTRSESSDASGSTIGSEPLLTPQPSVDSGSHKQKQCRVRAVFQRPHDRSRHHIDTRRHDLDDERVYVLESSDDERLYVLEDFVDRSPSLPGRFGPDLEFSRKPRPVRPAFYSPSQDDYLNDRESSRPRAMPRIIRRQPSVRHVDPNNRRRPVPSDDIDRTGDRLRVKGDARLGRKVRWSDEAASEFEGIDQHIESRRRSRLYRHDYSEKEREDHQGKAPPRVQR